MDNRNTLFQRVTRHGNGSRHWRRPNDWRDRLGAFLAMFLFYAVLTALAVHSIAG